MSDCATQINLEQENCYENKAIKIEPQDENVIFIQEAAQTECIQDAAQTEIVVKNEVECEEEKITNYDGEKLQDANTSEGVLLLYSCIFCDKIFITATALNAHKAVHPQTNSDERAPDVIGETEVKQEVKVECDEEMMMYNTDSEQPDAQDPLNDDSEAAATKVETELDVPDDPEEEVEGLGEEAASSIVINGRTLFPCKFCGEVLANVRVLRNHVTLCDAVNKTQSAVAARTPKAIFQCDVCNKYLYSNRGLMIHMRVHTGEKPPKLIYKCFDCNKYYASKKRLKIHMRLHTGEKPYKCDICDMEFRESVVRNRHMKMHSGEEKCACEICGKEFFIKKSLEIHMQIHLEDKPFKCELCGKGFPRKCPLDAHMKMHSSASYLCGICHRFIKTKQGYDAHVADHTETTFTCKLCDKKYTKRNSYVMHLKSHGGKRFKCETCGKDFSRKVYLDVHANTHTDEKTFMCEICGKNFYKSALLSRHKYKHFDKKPHQCDCGKGFVFLSQLRTHRCALMKKRPFRCDVCCKLFDKDDLLKQHMETQHKED